MILDTGQCFILINVLHLAWALAGQYRFDADTTFNLQEILVNQLLVEKKFVALTAVNSPKIPVKHDTVNFGRMIFKTNEFAEALKGSIDFKFCGNYYNQNTFVIQHSNSRRPLHVRIGGSFKKYRSSVVTSFYAGNSGEMIFLSNGPALEDEEFLLELSEIFENTGSIAILGTNIRKAHLKILTPPKSRSSWLQTLRRTKSVFGNAGYIVLQNAYLRQAASFDGRIGCIALGEGSKFVADALFSMKLQKVFFNPGASWASLLIQAKDSTKNAIYTVVNFPKGSSIRIDRVFDDVEVSDTRVKFRSKGNNGSVTVIFEGIIMAREKFQFRDHLLTYRGDAFGNRDHYEGCKQVHQMMKRALLYEIKP